MKIDALDRRSLGILLLLLLLNTVNFVDRKLPYILGEAIRSELQLTDAQFGLMAGLPIAVFGSVAAIVLARLADRFSARAVLSASLAGWSLATAACGLAQSFSQMFTARVAVVIAESGSMPSAHALLARIFPAQSRSFAFAIFSLAVPIGGTLGLVLGGWLNDAMGWRQAFFLVGLPGVVLAALVWLALPADRGPTPLNRPSTSLAVAVKHLFRYRSFLHTTVACVLFGIPYFAMAVFGPAFLIRVHGQTTAQAGLILGIASGIGGLVGILGGGVLADALGRRDPRWRQYVPAIGVALCVPAALGAWLVTDTHVTLVLLTLMYSLGLLCHAPAYANIQLLSAEDMRATASAILSFCIALVGASVGPFSVGWISDHLSPQFGTGSLRYALCAVCLLFAWSAAHFFLAGRVMARDLAAHGSTVTH
jgi:MFS transporter, Spinster family, sphingosine-1-phosphate transporter